MTGLVGGRFLPRGGPSSLSYIATLRRGHHVEARGLRGDDDESGITGAEQVHVWERHELASYAEELQVWERRDEMSENVRMWCSGPVVDWDLVEEVSGLHSSVLRNVAEAVIRRIGGGDIHSRIGHFSPHCCRT